ncbi:hypothetical protein CEXT_210251 [Caerostris extrusa]|uniref:Uncharacterized protein n=1 Tax=Caerostris extrusa TaxID=172846 RepID=A0AAV4XK82_CAEEX|nr:hypothetical protein CEXT_210251 [Caerostris extrusa]
MDGVIRKHNWRFRAEPKHIFSSRTTTQFPKTYHPSYSPSKTSLNAFSCKKLLRLTIILPFEPIYRHSTSVGQPNRHCVVSVGWGSPIPQIRF